MTDADRGPEYIEVQGALRYPGEWFLCEQPERPWDGSAAIHDCCPACLVGARAAVARGDGANLRYEPGHFEEPRGLSLADVVADLTERIHAFGPAPRLATRRSAR